MRSVALITAGVLLLVAPALADWDLGDGHKMHFPQLPDPNGWDVYATYYEGLADDWTCSGTGLVKDIHFWGSWKDDAVGNIDFFHVAIWSDDPVGDQGVPGEDPDNTYSKPLERLWHEDFFTAQGEITSRQWGGPSSQGWLDPRQDPDVFLPNNHQYTYQYNLYPDGSDEGGLLFEQQEGTVYWLEVSAKLVGFEPTERWGWKTADTGTYPDPYTGNHYMDDAIWAHTLPTNVWMDPLEDQSSNSLDLAFVITPEPATLSLLTLGGLALIRRRR